MAVEVDACFPSGGRCSDGRVLQRFGIRPASSWWCYRRPVAMVLRWDERPIVGTRFATTGGAPQLPRAFNALLRVCLPRAASLRPRVLKEGKPKATKSSSRIGCAVVGRARATGCETKGEGLLEHGADIGPNSSCSRRRSHQSALIKGLLPTMWLASRCMSADAHLQQSWPPLWMGLVLLVTGRLAWRYVLPRHWYACASMCDMCGADKKKRRLYYTEP